MTFESLAVIAYTLAALVPGVLVNAVSALIVRPRAEDAQLTLVRYLTLSALAYSVGFPLIYWLLESPWPANHPGVAALLWAVVALVIPVLLGLFLGAAVQKGWARSALQALGLKPVHVLPTAWDYVFASREGTTYALVTLKSARTIAGAFGPGSFAADTSHERDLYLEQVYRVGATGEWLPVQYSRGILITGGEIAHIELFGLDVPTPASQLAARVGATAALNADAPSDRPASPTEPTHPATLHPRSQEPPT